MIKKGFFIAASLMIVGCGAKSNGTNNNANNNTQEVKPPVENIDDIKEKPTPIPEPINPDPKPDPTPDPDPKPDPTPEPEPIKPAPIPEPKPIKPDPNTNYLLKFYDRNIAKYKLLTITTNRTMNIISDRFDPFNVNNFIVTVQKSDLNTLIFTFEGRIDLENYKKESAYIDCSKKTVQKVSFKKEGYRPENIEILENGCIYTDNILSPLITYDSFRTNSIMTLNYTFIFDESKDPEHKDLPDLYQTILFKISDTTRIVNH